MFGQDDFFYPHTLCYTTNNGRDFLQWVECRDQPNNTGGVISVSTQREVVEYKSLVFIPNKYKDFFDHPTAKFNQGDEIQIVEPNGRVRLQGHIIRISIDGLEDNRIWIQ